VSGVEGPAAPGPLRGATTSWHGGAGRCPSLPWWPAGVGPRKRRTPGRGRLGNPLPMADPAGGV
jgi:hypothetical protein